MNGSVARVYADIGLPHLDRPFDYAIPEALAGLAQPGVRVKVRFAGRRADGWLVDVADGSEVPPERLTPLLNVVSPEIVLPPRSVTLLRAVADHCGGTFCDVARLAVPPRHAATEKSEAARARAVEPAADLGETVTEPPISPLDLYPAGREFSTALAAGRSPRAAWTVVPVAAEAGDWADAFAAAAVATLASGRTALLLAPDGAAAARLQRAAEARAGKKLVAAQTAGLGPAARYRGFLRALHGDARIVVGTRAAAYVPLPELGLIAQWDDGDDLYDDQRAPYPTTRDVVALRAAQEHAAVLFAGFARSSELAAWVGQGWAKPIALPVLARRRPAPRTQIAAQSEAPGEPAGRLPHDVFTVVRDGLAFGPVLVQVPHRGLGRNLFCARCGAPVRCACGGPLGETPERSLKCGWCGRPGSPWRCRLCESARYRAATVGHQRTARELELAFPGVSVVRSSGDERLDRVGGTPALVVATPGAEPPADGGYAAAVLLDGAALLGRAGLKAGEEALRRWLRATALVRPGADGGTALLVAPPTDRVAQAWLRLDPEGFAERELADRREAGLPPARRMAAIEGDEAAVGLIAADLLRPAEPGLAGWLELLGPVPRGAGTSRLLLRAAPGRGRDLARLVHALAAARSAAKAPGAVGFRLDPDGLA